MLLKKKFYMFLKEPEWGIYNNSNTNLIENKTLNKFITLCGRTYSEIYNSGQIDILINFSLKFLACK